MSHIKSVIAREILDSRGVPTVQVDVSLGQGIVGTASVPSGASTGEHESIELRDQDHRYGGKGVLKAVQNVNDIIAPELIGKDASLQRDIDCMLCQLDGTDNKAKLGANAILGVSLAVARAASIWHKKPLYQWIREAFSISHDRYHIPLPMMNVLNGGAHADNSLDFQEFMIIPYHANKFSESLRMGVEVFISLKKVLQEMNLNTSVGDEGGFAPNLTSNEQALQVLVKGITQSGYKVSEDVKLALDVASSEFYQDGRYQVQNEWKTADEMMSLYSEWTKLYPIVSIEDGYSENDWDGWVNLTKTFGDKIQLVGDDLFCTNIDRLRHGIKKNVANSILIKLNQIGSLSETIDTIQLAHKNSYRCVISHRSGETEDTFIADLAVAVNAGQIKTGSLSRSERIAKYNRLLKIEEECGEKSYFSGGIFG